MRRVLVIDDEEMICAIFETVLTIDDRFVVGMGSSGSDLRELLAAHDDVVAIICDHALCGETGIAIQANIEPALRERRIAFVLVHGAGEDLRNALPIGYFQQRQIIEVHKPMPHIMDIVGIIDGEVNRLRS